MMIAGYVVIGLVVGLVGGFIWGAIRERKGKNKKWTEVINIGRCNENEYSIYGAGYGKYANGIPCSFFYRRK